MKQSSFRFLGLFDLILVTALAGVFGPQVLVAPAVILFVVGGLAASLTGLLSALTVGPVHLTWRQLAALTYFAFALLWPALYLPDVIAGTAVGFELLLFVVMSGAALIFAFIGVDILRGGDHFSIEPNVERVIAI